MITWEYLAGFFDGEGWISIERKGNSTTQRVGISQNNKPLLQLIQQYIGMGEIRDGSGKSLGNYRLQICKRADVKAFLECLEPFLILRKAEAKIMIEFCSIDRGVGCRLTDEERQKQADLTDSLRDAFLERKAVTYSS